MMTKTSGDYLTNRGWLSDIINGDNFILCCGSALEFLQMFVGYVNEKEIDVYATAKGEYDNINYRIVESFDNIDYFKKDNTLCTTFTQTINDMLADFDHTDELALTEALCNYYYEHGETFDGLFIKPESQAIFDTLKTLAIEYCIGA